MKSICIDCRYVGARPSGIGEMVKEIVERIPWLAPDLSFLLLRNPRRNEALSKAPNVTELEVTAAANGPGTMWWLPNLVDMGQVQLFHATANILPARLPMPTVTTVHDIMWLTHPHWCNPGPYGLIERAFYGHGIRRAINHSTQIAALSNATKRTILERNPQAEDRISVIHSGVSDRFRPIRPEASQLQRLGLHPHQRFVLSVGQYAPYKNHKGALRAFASGLASQENVAMVFVQRQGRGEQELRDLARQLNVEDRVHIMAAISPEELVLLYSAAEALLHPSLAEGFGNPIVEAMACGCPVITSNRSAIPEVAGGAAKLVDPLNIEDVAAALCEVVNDDSTQETLGKAGFARARALSWENAASQYVALYREVIDRE